MCCSLLRLCPFVCSVSSASKGSFPFSYHFPSGFRWKVASLQPSILMSSEFVASLLYVYVSPWVQDPIMFCWVFLSCLVGESIVRDGVIHLTSSKGYQGSATLQPKRREIWQGFPVQLLSTGLRYIHTDLTPKVIVYFDPLSVLRIQSSSLNSLQNDSIPFHPASLPTSLEGSPPISIIFDLIGLARYPAYIDSPPSFTEMLMTYNICKFKAYDVLIWYMYVLWNHYHNKVS